MDAITRRKFLEDSAALLTSGLFLGNLSMSRAFAQSKGNLGPLLVHIKIPGGAHSPMGLNPLLLSDLYSRNLDPLPRDNDREFLASYRDDELIKAGPHLLGVAGGPLAPLASDISIVNGVMMLADLPFHETNEAFMISGDDEGKDKEFAEQMMKQFDPSVFGLAWYGSSLNARMKIEDSVPLLDLENGRRFMREVGLMHASGSLVDNNSYLEKLKRQLPEINERFGKFESARSGLTRSEDPGANWINLLLPAMSANLVNYASINLGNFQVDSHSDHDRRQRTTQIEVFSQFASLIKMAKSIPDQGGSLYDRMVIMVTTEFARTSYAESRDGTGHNPYNNSVLLSGGLIKTGVNLGNSTIIPTSRVSGRSRLQALPFNYSSFSPLSYEQGISFATQAQKPAAALDGQGKEDYIYPGNVLKTVSLAMGLEPTKKTAKYNILTPLLRGV